MTEFTDQQLIELYNKNETFQSLYSMKCIDLDTKRGTIQFEFDIDKKYSLLCGICLGYPSNEKINSFEAHRLSPSEIMAQEK